MTEDWTSVDDNDMTSVDDNDMTYDALVCGTLAQISLPSLMTAPSTEQPMKLHTINYIY